VLFDNFFVEWNDCERNPAGIDAREFTLAADAAAAGQPFFLDFRGFAPQDGPSGAVITVTIDGVVQRIIPPDPSNFSLTVTGQLANSERTTVHVKIELPAPDDGDGEARLFTIDSIDVHFGSAG